MNEQPDLQDQGLPLTALAVAAGRAVETSRPDPLITDPFALALVEAAHSHVDFPTRWPSHPEALPPQQQPLLLASIYIGLRTRFIDAFLEAGTSTPQTVLLGAGLDTRAYRLPWPDGARVFEIDHAKVLAFKAAVLDRMPAVPGCELLTVAADLSLPWRRPLLESGFDPMTPTTWILEGLLPYLDAAAQLAVLTGVVALSAPGSRAVIERAVALPKTEDMEAKLREYSEQTGLPMNELLARANPPDPFGLLTSSGWKCTEHPVRELCLTYNRTLSLDSPGPSGPLQAPPPGHSRGGFVTALNPA